MMMSSVAKAAALANPLRNSGAAALLHVGERAGQHLKKNFHKCQVSCDVVSHSQGPRMLNKMIKRQQKKLNSTKRKQDAAKPKKLHFEDSKKMKTFNIAMKENLTLVLFSQQYQDIVAGQGLVLTQVRVNPSFAEMYVMYETSSNDPEGAKALDTFLDQQANNIRLDCEALSLMGQLPKLKFIRDVGGGLAMPTAEELQRIVIRQRQMSNPLLEEANEEGQEVDEVEVTADFSHLRFLKPKTDSLRFDRDRVMEKIMKEIQISKPEHRQGKYLE